MESTKETGILSTILPPRLEDAGLENCALPPDSIKEAFFKAASAVKSRIFTDDQDPFPERASDAIIGGSGGGVSDALIGGELGSGSGPCVAVKGGGVVEEGKDEVVVVGGDDVADIEGKNCGDDVAEKGGNGEEEKREGQKPILVGGFV